MEFEHYKTLPNALKRYREAKGLTQREVADFLGHKDTGWVSHIESGDTLPNLVSLMRLAVMYETSVEELFPGLVNAIQEEQLGRKIGLGALRRPTKILDSREASGTLATHDAR